MIQPLAIAGRKCGPGCPPLMLAEEGQANDGNHDLALRMIDVAADAGADIIEFQLGIAADLYITDDPGFSIYKTREFSPEQIALLVCRAHDRGIGLQAACLSSALVSVCAEAGADSFCVNAMDIDNPVMLDAVAKTGRPFWIATLMSTLSDVDWAVDYVKKAGCTGFGLLHGQHVMSAEPGTDMPPEVMQLDCIGMFADRYNVPVGYVDHTPVAETPALAVLKGAALVCKHIAPSVDWRGPDWAVALPPEEWKRARRLFDRAAKMGGSTKEVGELEAADQPIHRRSLRAVRDIGQGEVLSVRDLVALRPGGGMSPRFAERLLGRKVRRALSRNETITPDDVEGQ